MLLILIGLEILFFSLSFENSYPVHFYDLKLIRNLYSRFFHESLKTKRDFCESISKQVSVNETKRLLNKVLPYLSLPSRHILPSFLLYTHSCLLSPLYF